MVEEEPMDKGTKGIMAMDQGGQGKYTEKEPESRPQDIKLIMTSRRRYVDTFKIDVAVTDLTNVQDCTNVVQKLGRAKRACRIIHFTSIRHWYPSEERPVFFCT